jgi:hypothetical protein
MLLVVGCWFVVKHGKNALSTLAMKHYEPATSNQQRISQP